MNEEELVKAISTLLRGYQEENWNDCHVAIECGIDSDNHVYCEKIL